MRSSTSLATKLLCGWLLLACASTPESSAAPAAPEPAAPSESEPGTPSEPAAPSAPAAPTEPAAPAEPSAPAAEPNTAEPKAPAASPKAEAPTERPKAEPAPSAEAPAAPAAATGPCGEEGQPMCPLQAFMEKQVQEPFDAGDLQAVSKALQRVAKLAPDPAWNSSKPGWAVIANEGATAAASADPDETGASCKACHKAFRKKYKESFRKRPL